MGINYVHTLGDSTLDNIFWMLNKDGSNEETAKQNCVEGQLHSKLNDGDENTYKVVSHAYDGFTTSSLLSGDIVGRVLSGWKGSEKSDAYFRSKHIQPISQDRVYPLKDLKEFIDRHLEQKHYIIISIGGNDFRERLLYPTALLQDIPKIQERYLQILKEINPLKDKNIRPILMLQYRPNANSDCYCIYLVMKIIGVALTSFYSLGLLGMGMSITTLVMQGMNMQSLGFLTLSTGLFAVSQLFLPLRLAKNILTGEKAGMTTLGGLMETFYRPILQQAKADAIPILDLPNTFNPYNNDLYISQIEPSQQGGELIAKGLEHIIKHHDFDSAKSMIYARKKPDAEFTAIQNPGSKGWAVEYPEMKSQ